MGAVPNRILRSSASDMFLTYHISSAALSSGDI
jgi:hypothetical protein